MKSFFKRLSSPQQLRSLVALGLAGVSLVVVGIAFQLNTQQTLMHTQVIRTNALGEEERMIFRDFRDQQVESIEQLSADCKQRNELFGDGTGEICERYREQLKCVKRSLQEDSLLECLAS